MDQQAEIIERQAREILALRAELAREKAQHEHLRRGVTRLVEQNLVQIGAAVDVALAKPRKAAGKKR